MQGSKGYSKYDGKFSTGQKFGKLTVIEPSVIFLSDGKRNGRGEAKIKVKCECGVEKLAPAGCLINGRNRSCGCEVNAATGQHHHNWTGSEHISGTTFRRIKNRAVQIGVEFSLILNNLEILLKKQKYKCILSGLDINQKTMSLDRIDSSKGYIEGNV